MSERHCEEAKTTKQFSLDCFAEPVLGPAFGRTWGLAMTLE